MKPFSRIGILSAAGLYFVACGGDPFTVVDSDAGAGTGGSGEAGSPGGEGGSGGHAGSGAASGKGGASGSSGSGDSGGSSGQAGQAGQAGEGAASGSGGAEGGSSGSAGSHAGSGGADGGSGASGGTAGSGGSGGSDGECAKDADCTDANVCNGKETCQDKTCKVGTPLGDGTACEGGTGGAHFCQNSECIPSVCGDSIVDENTGEVCDDGDQDETNGCKNDCTFTCANDAACSDGSPCNGDEHCVSHQCDAGENATLGTACTGPTSGSYICDGEGDCQPSTCGDGFFDETSEDCEEAGGPNHDDTDGCTDACKYTCTMDAECLDLDLCDGSETCNTTAHKCLEATDPLDCTDQYACTTEECIPLTGCKYTLVDKDKDGYPPLNGDANCIFNGQLMAFDCDDNDKNVHPNTAWYPDCDHDKFPMNIAPTYACGEPLAPPSQCAAGDWIKSRSDVKLDCNDSEGTRPQDYRPDQTEFFTTASKAGDYDYDCDGVKEQQYPLAAKEVSCVPTSGCAGTGFKGPIPACGEKAGELFKCAVKDQSSCTTSLIADARQPCH